jgi:hypothetical protein
MNKGIKNSKSLRLVSIFILASLLSLGIETGFGKNPTQSQADDHYKKKYNFSEDWFTWNLPIWEEILGHLRGKPNIHYLEIGVFEGRSLIWMLENILTHPTSKATCIDVFRQSKCNKR